MKERTRECLSLSSATSPCLFLSSSFPPPLIPAAAPSLHSHWCLPRLPSASLSWNIYMYFFFHKPTVPLFSWNLFTKCTIERSKALLPWTNSELLRPISSIWTCCHCAAVMQSVSVLLMPHQYFGCPPCAFLLFLIPVCCYTEACVSVCLSATNKASFFFFGGGSGWEVCGLLLKTEVVLRVNFGLVSACLWQLNDSSP